jgi:hypothetical protein
MGNDYLSPPKNCPSRNISGYAPDKQAGLRSFENEIAIESY